MSLNDNKAVRYLSVSDIYNINDEITGGHTFVRDVHLLNSAAERPKMMLFGEAQFPSLVDKAASLLHSLAYHHLFADGNKRTAIRAASRFLNANGWQLTWSEAAQQAFILEIAQGKYDVAQIAERLAPYVEPIDASGR